MVSLNIPRRHDWKRADVGLPRGRRCGRREGLAAGLHGAARGGARRQRGGDWAAAGGEGQPGEDLGMEASWVDHGPIWTMVT